MRTLNAVGGLGLVAFAALTMLTGWSELSWQPLPPAENLRFAVAPHDRNEAIQSVALTSLRGLQSSIRAVPPMSTRSFLNPSAMGKPLIFVSDDYATVNIYLQTAKHQLVGWITGLNGPTDLTTDAAGNVYIAINGGFSGTPTVLVYAPPYTKAPALMLQTGPYPFGVSVSPQGVVAVTGCTTMSSGCANSVTFYAKGSPVPCATVLTSPAFYPGYDAFDEKGNLYVDGSGASSGGLVGEIDGGCNAESMIALATGNTIGFADGIQLDRRGRIAIMDSGPNAVIDTYLRPKKGSLGNPVSTTPLTNSPSANTFTFLASGRAVWVADANGPISKYDYPIGGLSKKTIIGGGFPTGIAVTPPLHP